MKDSEYLYNQILSKRLEDKAFQRILSSTKDLTNRALQEVIAREIQKRPLTSKYKKLRIKEIKKTLKDLEVFQSFKKQSKQAKELQLFQVSIFIENEIFLNYSVTSSNQTKLALKNVASQFETSARYNFDNNYYAFYEFLKMFLLLRELDFYKN